MRNFAVTEKEMEDRFWEAVPKFIIGECINATKELPLMSNLIISMESTGYIERAGGIQQIVPGPIEVSFDFEQETIGARETMYGKVVHTGKDFSIRIMNYNPMIVMKEW